MGGEDEDVSSVANGILYEKLIPNSTREFYDMTRMSNNKSSWSQG